MTALDIFADIRPYNDEEVPAALQRLITDPEFIELLVSRTMPRWLRPVKTLYRWLLVRKLHAKAASLGSVSLLQHEVAKYLEMVLAKTCDGVTYTGLDRLDKNQTYLFISNHRDIALDPALVNWGLYQNQMKPVRIAIGDNLLKKPFVTELMRLNKSFIVKRSAKGPKEMLAALGQLSHYICHSLSDGESVWIAQREGRTKDGNDQTEPALLKMIHMHGRKQKLGFSEYLDGLRIVPVSISYQVEPCAVAKANELEQRAQTGTYTKSELEDIQSIISGFSSYKGRIHVHFGEVISGGYDDADQLAALLDQQIDAGFHLFPDNYLAADVAHESITADARAAYQARLQLVPERLRARVQAMYAKPVHKRQRSDLST